MTPNGEARFVLPFTEAHNLTNALCAIAIGVALDAPVEEMAVRAPDISFSRLRGELLDAARRTRARERLLQRQPRLDARRARPPRLARRPAAAGSPSSAGWPSWARTGPRTTARPVRHARELGIDLVVGVGETSRTTTPRTSGRPTPEDAVEVVEGLLGEGDAVLVKGSRSVGLEAFTDELDRTLGASGLDCPSPRSPSSPPRPSTAARS